MASDFMDWFKFNIENAQDVFYIQNLKKKPTKTFREYATHWRSEAAKVRPSLDEEHMNKLIVRAQDPQYYERLIIIEDHKFSDIIKLGERIEEGIKSEMVTNFKALQATNKTPPPTYQVSPPTYQHSSPRYSQPATVHHTYNSQPSHFQSPPARQNYPRPRPNINRKPPRLCTPFAEPIDQLYERLKATSYVTPIPNVSLENPSQWVNPNKTFAYHSDMKGHTTTECRTLKDKIQTLIDNKVIQAKEAAHNVHNNPLPNHRGDGVHMIETNEELDPERSIELIREGDDFKVAVTLTPIVVQTQEPIEVEVIASIPFEVEVVLPTATPATFEVEVVTAFIVTNSEAHKNALMKVLSEAYVPNNITSGEMANMVGQVLESHKIIFHEDEQPPEGLNHNQALHITVQFEGKFIARVLVDGGSSLNICPLDTLKRLDKGFHEIRVGSMNLKAFYGSQRATIREINLCL
ncbi:uncharacterized protein [Nicotiana sylvestris]|uniref:uncharacterized protein n=1 Tax=Nicotiana sylvestris TaxID=4096 RepID=UPI00388C7E0A